VTAPLIEVLHEARDLGFLGPGPVEAHLDHAQGFVAAVDAPPRRFLDLGSGGGVPGLVLAEHWAHAGGVLLDGSSKRTAFLRRAVATLGFGTRVLVVLARAEQAGHDEEWRGQFDLVVARSFGPPAVTAEYGAAFLEPGGSLLVSDPPEDADRWPSALLESCGLVAMATEGPVRRLIRRGEYPSTYPRRRPRG
jgi:16S rRNA (guanine527-N7)-methyltransferase